MTTSCACNVFMLRCRYVSDLLAWKTVCHATQRYPVASTKFSVAVHVVPRRLASSLDKRARSLSLLQQSLSIMSDPILWFRQFVPADLPWFPRSRFSKATILLSPAFRATKRHKPAHSISRSFCSNMPSDVAKVESAKKIHSQISGTCNCRYMTSLLPWPSVASSALKNMLPAAPASSRYTSSSIQGM